MKKNFTREFREECPEKTEIYFYQGMPYAMYDAVTSDVHLALPYSHLLRPENYKFSLGFKGFIRLRGMVYEDQKVMAEHWANVLFGKPISPAMEAKVKELWDELTNPPKRSSCDDRAFVFVKQDYHEDFEVNYFTGGIVKKATITDRTITTKTINTTDAIEQYCKFWGVDEYTSIKHKPFCITQQLARNAYNMYTSTSSWRSTQHLGVCVVFDRNIARNNNQVGTLIEVTQRDLNGKCLGVKMVLNTDYRFTGAKELIVAHTHPLFTTYQEKNRWSNSFSHVSSVVARMCGLIHNGDGKIMYEGDEPLAPEAINVVCNLRYRMDNPSNEYADSPLVRILLNKESLDDVLKDVHNWIEVHEHYHKDWKNNVNPMDHILEFSGCTKSQTVPRYSLWPKTAKTVIDYIAETEASV